MSLFIPTFIYIKQHLDTGKLYFGKTIQNPENYTGSGTYWNNHIKKYGKERVINLWYCLFLDQKSITEFALWFSERYHIVESEEWANLIPENGNSGGGVKGRKLRSRSVEHNQKISAALKNRTNNFLTTSTKSKISVSMLGNTNSQGTRILKDQYHISRPKLECPHCGKITAINIAKSKHFTKCKFLPQ